MKTNETISGTYSKLAFSGRVVKTVGGLVSVEVVNPHRNLPCCPTMIDGKWGKALTFHVNDKNVTID